MNDSIRDSKIRQLEARVGTLERKMAELARLLKRSEDHAVQRAARRAQ